jgi:hypothetical protein
VPFSRRNVIEEATTSDPSSLRSRRTCRRQPALQTAGPSGLVLMHQQFIEKLATHRERI